MNDVLDAPVRSSVASDPARRDGLPCSSTEEREGKEIEMATTGQQGMARPGSRMTFSPFSVVRRMFDDMEQLLEAGTGRVEAEEPRAAGPWLPRIDMVARGGKLVVRADLPGLAMEDIRVTLEQNALIIDGERRTELEETEGEVWRAERIHGRFRRVIPLPDGVESDTAEARFANGVLEITMRAPDSENRGRRIEIRSGAESESH
jgi:HSP20 family protein